MRRTTRSVSVLTAMVMASALLCLARAEQGQEQPRVTVPDSVQIVTLIDGGARGLYHISGITLLGPEKQIHLYGSRGTIKYLIAPEEKLLCGRAGDKEMRYLEIPAEQRGGWRVEAEFIASVRGQDKIHYTDFATGVRYMEFTEAVARSAALDLPVDLPLKNLA